MSTDKLRPPPSGRHSTSSSMVVSKEVGVRHASSSSSMVVSKEEGVWRTSSSYCPPRIQHASSSSCPPWIRRPHGLRSRGAKQAAHGVPNLGPTGISRGGCGLPLPEQHGPGRRAPHVPNCYAPGSYREEQDNRDYEADKQGPLVSEKDDNIFFFQKPQPNGFWLCSQLTIPFAKATSQAKHDLSVNGEVILFRSSLQSISILSF